MLDAIPDWVCKQCAEAYFESSSPAYRNPHKPKPSRGFGPLKGLESNSADDVFDYAATSKDLGFAPMLFITLSAFFMGSMFPPRVSTDATIAAISASAAPVETNYRGLCHPEEH